MNSNEIREVFLRFFEGKGHTVLPGSSLIPQGDPTLLLTTAGMVQIKPYFLGLATPPNPRLASCQKCFRTTDIDQVGDSKHLTFFEMLGNFSVGDYFKKEAIEWAWEFVTQAEWLGLPPERLWITIFLDDEEAFNYWRGIGVPAERIVRLGEEENFWGPAGDSGPCGPCSEIHYDFGEDSSCGKPGCGPACDCSRFSEIWNLVFTQYDQDREGNRTPLPKPNIDTGMGLERVAAVMQGKTSVYENDLFDPIIRKVAGLAGKRYGQDEEVDRTIRIAAEHARGIVFLINDGVIPGNERRGYVLRRLLRRTVLFGRKLGIEGAFLNELAATIITGMGDIYPELVTNRDFISVVINSEEERFEQTLYAGLNWLDRIMEKAKDKRITGDSIFMLYDTLGFPSEITAEIAAERGFSVDLEGFEQTMERQRERARAAHKFETGDQADLQLYEQLIPSTVPIAYEGETYEEAKNKALEQAKPLDLRFVGYEKLNEDSVIMGLLVNKQVVETAYKGQEVELVLNATPFYGEMGGQVGDTGKILKIDGDKGEMTVTHTFRPLPDIIVHSGQVIEGTLSVGNMVEAKIDRYRRDDIARNHTATHLLQAALRAVLGEQVRQSGSLVAPDRLRFDFTHHGSVSKEQLTEIQLLVNENIRQNLPVESKTMAYTEAVSKGAIALFGEKYSDTVRILEIGDPPVSMELCGGTHVKSTGEIGFFLITTESSIGSGLRRIEAVTGREAEILIGRHLYALETLAKELETSPEEVQGKLSAALTELDKERKRALSLERELAKREAASLLDKVEVVSDIKVLSARVSTASPEAMREVGDQLKEEMGSGIIVLGAIYNDRPNFVAMVTPDLVAKKFNAGEIVKRVAKAAGGGGGGKAELGQGSGKDKGKLDEALGSIKDIVLDLFSEDEESLISKGNSLSDLERYEEAVACFDKAIKLNPKNEDSWLDKGWNLGRLGRHEEAVACYDKAIELKPSDDLAWFNKGNRLSDLGRYEEAIACYDKVLETNPVDTPAWYNKGNRLDDLGRHEEAIACYDKVIELNHSDCEAWHSKGKTLERLGKKDEAEKCLKKAGELGFQEN